MYCPKCKFTADKFMAVCPTCHEQLIHPKTSRLAVWSLILSLLGLLIFKEHFWGVTSFVAIIIGTISLIKLYQNREYGGKIFAYTGIILATITVFLVPYLNSAEYKAERILKDGRLAALPKSATAIKIEGWSGIFTGETHLVFDADPCEIEVFVNTSPSIKNLTPEKSHNHRTYSIPPYQHHNWGTLDVDDNAHSVSIHLIWS